MKKLIFIISLLIGTNAFAKVQANIAKSASEFVPNGFVIFEEINGDLNKDGLADKILIIKGTDKDKLVDDKYRGKLDRNRRGLIIAFKKKDHYEQVLVNLDCFSSENEDGGVYFPPELSISIKRGNLFISYAHGRYGYWIYNFRYQNSDFELIGFDRSENRGPLVERVVSINFLTKKILIKDNINLYEEGADEKFKESWKKFTIEKEIQLSEIADFDDLILDPYLR